MILNNSTLFCRGGMSVERQLVSLKSDFPHGDIFYELARRETRLRNNFFNPRLEPGREDLGQLGQGNLC